MARVEIAAQGWGWIADRHGEGIGGATVTIKNTDGSNAATWSAITGGTSSTGAVTTASDGTIPRFIDAGSYDVTVQGVTRRVEAVSGSVESDSLALRRLTEQGRAELTKSNAAHRIAFEDATTFVEPWTNTAAWSTNGFQVSGGKVYGPSAGNAMASHAFAISASGRARYVAAIDVPAAGAAAGLVFVGLSKDAAGVTPVGGNTIGIGFDPGQSSKPLFWRGAAMGGAGITYPSATTLPAGTYYVTVAVDENQVSLSMVSADHSIEYATVIPRSTLGTLTNLVVWNSDSRQLTGAAIRPVAAKLASATIAPRSAEILGTADSVILTKPTASSAQSIRVHLPSSYDSRQPLPLVIAHHGHGRDAQGTYTDAQLRTYYQGIANGGYIVAASDAHGDVWGNPASVADYEDLYRYVRDHYAISCVLLNATSMGGLSSLTMLARRAIPNILGWAGIAPVCSLRSIWDGNLSTFRAELQSAYGVAANGSDWTAKTAGSDPMLRGGAEFRGVPMRVWTSNADNTVPPADHATPLLAKVASYAPESTLVPFAGTGHVDQANFDIADTLAFYARCVAS